VFGANVQYIKCSVLMSSIYTMFCVNVQYIHSSVLMSPDFPKLAEKYQSFGLTDMKILSDRKIFCRSEKPTVMCIMFSLTFLECFTLVLAIGHLISPLVFIEVKVIQFLVFSVVQNCICYVFYRYGCMKD
jgi:hypothetical protein